MSVPVGENEAGITIDNIQIEAIPHLFNPLLSENTLHICKHRNFTNTCFCFRGCDLKSAFSGVFSRSVNQVVVDFDDFILEVTVFPS